MQQNEEEQYIEKALNFVLETYMYFLRIKQQHRRDL